MTWALVIFTAVMAAPAIAASVLSGRVSYAEIDECMHGNSFPVITYHTREECEASLDAGASVFRAIFVLWLTGFVVLSLIWFKRRPRSPSQPRPSGSPRRRP
jgi:hypothetical protein